MYSIGVWAALSNGMEYGRRAMGMSSASGGRW